MVDRFPEAFKRFEHVVDTDKFRNYRELAYSFSVWAGKNWRDSFKQNLALKREGQKLGFKDAEIPMYLRRASTSWRTTARYGKHRGFRNKQILVVNEGIRKGYSANKIQRELKNQGIGVRRKVLLRQIREMKIKSLKANSQKYTPRKYRSNQNK